MKIIVISIGTRGDMEPFMAVGEILRERGHQVICMFPEQFSNLAEDSGFEFASLDASMHQENFRNEVCNFIIG